MRVVIFGASGMVGQGVLRECLLDQGVTEVLSVARAALPAHLTAGQPKLRELICPQAFTSQNFSDIADELSNVDACYFPLGIASFRMSEQAYTRITHDLTLAVARILAQQSPNAVFVYISGEGTDATSKTMWARVKGTTENELLAMPFRAAYMFRPGGIIARNEERSKVPLYNAFYKLLKPLIPLFARMPKYVTDTEAVGRAMLRVTRDLPAERILNTAAINRIGR